MQRIRGYSTSMDELPISMDPSKIHGCVAAFVAPPHSSRGGFPPPVKQLTHRSVAGLVPAFVQVFPIMANCFIGSFACPFLQLQYWIFQSLRLLRRSHYITLLLRRVQARSFQFSVVARMKRHGIVRTVVLVTRLRLSARKHVTEARRKTVLTAPTVLIYLIWQPARRKV